MFFMQIFGTEIANSTKKSLFIKKKVIIRLKFGKKINFENETNASCILYLNWKKNVEFNVNMY
jgi:hypothetical protein